ncbi:MAG: spore cortex-lytic enzyme [Clostridiales bacterium]|nr:spore cortex-lytic enzyme [Clostridiales bacterium]MCF8022518.1 spore cortex-lytic enzyme [Clostridiales bacterium]
MAKCIYKVIFTIFIAVIVIAGIYGYSLWGDHARAQEKVLYWGTNGSDVIKVQNKLSQWGYYDGIVDGVYGTETYRSVINFQRKNGLNPDGVVGKRTWAALGYNVSSASSARASTSSRGSTMDRNGTYVLAKVIAGEARAEPYLGKVSVGAVIMNRVQSSSFPNTVPGVIYQSLAFESVANGQYNQSPGDDALKAARQAMTGWDPTNGALYFWNPAKAVSPWIWSRNITMRIGKHVFGI